MGAVGDDGCADAGFTRPISLGSDGSLPTGSAPVFYFKGNGDAFNVNSGTGGDMTVTNVTIANGQAVAVATFSLTDANS